MSVRELSMKEQRAIDLLSRNGAMTIGALREHNVREVTLVALCRLGRVVREGVTYRLT